jgi:hypothetical protein
MRLEELEQECDDKVGRNVANDHCHDRRQNSRDDVRFVRLALRCGSGIGDVRVGQPLCRWPRFPRYRASLPSWKEASMSKGKILTTLATVSVLVLTSTVTPAAARWGWRGGGWRGVYGYGYVGNSFRPPAGQVWVRGFRNAPTRLARLRQDFQLDGAYR